MAYNVDKTGQLSPQPKFLALPAAIRLCARIGERIAQTTRMNFSDNGWQNLIAAIDIRNRITHPKSLDDLTLSDADVGCCIAALHWFLETSTELMQAALLAARHQVEGFRDVLDDLNAGDEETWQVYRSLISGDEGPA